MTDEELQARLAGQFPRAEALQPGVKGYLTIRVPSPSDLIPMTAWLKSQGFTYLDMVTAVDYLGPVDPKGYIADPNPNAFLPEGATPQIEVDPKSPGFPYREALEVVYCLSDLKARRKVFLKLEVPRQDARVPSLTPLFKAADWQEREAYDLLGVAFEDHPNLTKILTPDFIQGHPLRKDYAHVKDKYD